MTSNYEKIPDNYMSCQMLLISPERVASIQWDEYLGKNLKQWRILRQLTQSQLSELSGVNKKSIEHLELGKYSESGSRAGKAVTVPTSRLKALSDALGIELHELIVCQTQNHLIKIPKED
jgi:transcriptional regulator with XRE-family HTH domain